MTHKYKTPKWIHVFFVAFGVACFIPFLIVVSASFTNEMDLAREGFSILPPEFNTSAYEYLFENPMTVFNAYKITIFITLVGTLISILFMSLAAYALARMHGGIKKILTFYIFFPTLFSGGLVPSYIINTKYLKLTDNVWVLILPGLIGVFHVFMIRTFFQQLPDGLFDAAKIDGASEYHIYYKIAIPLSKPVLATVAFLGALSRWNSWYEAMLYIRSDEKVPLQYLLQRMMRNISAILNQMENVPSTLSGMDLSELPGENLRMAMLVVTIGPMMMFFPFFQKHFTRGMTVGSIKG